MKNLFFLLTDPGTEGDSQVESYPLARLNQRRSHLANKKVLIDIVATALDKKLESTPDGTGLIFCKDINMNNISLSSREKVPGRA